MTTPNNPRQRASAARPDASSSSAVPEVRCPQCLDMIRWDERTVYTDNGPVDLSLIADEVRREEAMYNAFVLCPNPSGASSSDHYLPLRYLRYQPPLVIGLVGRRATGKSTWLATMVDQIVKGGLKPYGIEARPLHRKQFEDYRKNRFERLLDDGEALPATPGAEENVEFTVAFLLTTDAGTRPVAFFDVGGESLAEDGKATRFLRAVGALMFVIDPAQIEASRDQTGDASGTGDPAFEAVLDRLAPVDASASQLVQLPAVEVLLKADTLKFDPIVGPWLVSDGPAQNRLDAQRMRRESRDVYAYLATNRASAWLNPFRRCARCTLHVVSATGGSPNSDRYYSRGLRPRRVLEPLVAILAMAGVLTGPQADLIGR